MELRINTDKKEITVVDGSRERTVPLYSTEGFELVSDLWVKVGWDQKYAYTFSWFGRPIIQLPEDMVRTQEVLWSVQPDVIVETGVAHGGSLIFYASLCKAMGKGRVVGVDIDIRPANRAAIEAHPLASFISLRQGSSTDPAIVRSVADTIKTGEKVLVILDSNHSYDHVAAELQAYAPLVTPGSYLVATDGIMESLYDVPRGTPGWKTDNPTRAAKDFAEKNRDFVLELPPRPFNESQLRKTPTHWPGAWLRRVG